MKKKKLVRIRKDWGNRFTKAVRTASPLDFMVDILGAKKFWELFRGVFETDKDLFISIDELMKTAKPMSKALKEVFIKELNRYAKVGLIAKPFIFDERAYWLRHSPLSLRLGCIAIMERARKVEGQILKALSKIASADDLTFLTDNILLLDNKYTTKPSITVEDFTSLPYPELVRKIRKWKVTQSYLNALCETDTPLRKIDLKEIIKDIYNRDDAILELNLLRVRNLKLKKTKPKNKRRLILTKYYLDKKTSSAQ